MPSPIAHLLTGIIIASAPMRRSMPIDLKRFLLCAAAAIVPDLDMLLTLIGFDYFYVHRTFSHSIITVLIIFSILWVLNYLFSRKYKHKIPHLLIPICLLSHIALDLFTEDVYGPRGIMLFWPISKRFFYLNINLFPSAFSATGKILPIKSLFLIGIRELIVIGLIYVTVLSIKYKVFRIKHHKREKHDQLKI